MTTNYNTLPNWKLPEEITRRLGPSSGKQRAIYEASHLLIVLHEQPKKKFPNKN